MAAGKTRVGQLVAHRLGRTFVDLDDVIVQRTGSSIRELFSSIGEEGFRAEEQRALAELMAQQNLVVATGGGAPCVGDTIARLRASGFVVALAAELSQLLARVSDPTTRPLLSKTPEQLQALYAEREPVYQRAHAEVYTSQKTEHEVAAEVAGLIECIERYPAEMREHTEAVSLGSRSYPIITVAGGLAEVGSLARNALGATCSTAAVITDANVAPHYLEPVLESIRAAGFSVSSCTVDAGEVSKSFDQFQRVVESVIAEGLKRTGAVFALGGGVVGDLAGFVAATVYRGVACVQIPTTILAMVDSAIGGKTGINVTAGKNLVGAFCQPSLVLADPNVLMTLPARERRAAFGEIVKYGLLSGETLFREVEALADDIGREPFAHSPRLSEVIAECARYKARIVGRDERETSGLRAILNLGHTVGHAIEAAAGYGQLLHGEAVGLGLLASCRVSAHLGRTGPELEQRVRATLHRAGLDVDLTPWLREDVLRHTKVDKKHTGASLRFVTTGGPGQIDTCALSVAQLVSFLATSNGV